MLKQKDVLTNTTCVACIFVELAKRSKWTQCDWAQVAAWCGYQGNKNLK